MTIAETGNRNWSGEIQSRARLFLGSTPACDPLGTTAGTSDRYLSRIPRNGRWLHQNMNSSTTAAAQSASGLNIRQAWVIQQLAQGATLERRLIEQKFHVHQKTAKRDLSELVRRRLIEYVRDGMGGHYRLLETRLSA